MNHVSCFKSHFMTHASPHQPCIELAFKSLSFFTHSNHQRRRMENNNKDGFCRGVKLIINTIRQTSGVMRKRRLSWVRDETKSSVRGLGLTFSYLLQVFVAERLAYWDTQLKSRQTLGCSNCFYSVLCSGPGQKLRVWMEAWVSAAGSFPLLSCTGGSSHREQCVLCEWSVWMMTSPHKCCYWLISQQDCSVPGDHTNRRCIPQIAPPHWSVNVQIRASMDPDWSKISRWSPLAADWCLVQWEGLNFHLLK